MATALEVQALLRFLSQDAKIPLPVAMSRVKNLQEATLTSPELISKADIASIQAIFNDEKISKQVHVAAKRASKKRAAGDNTSVSPMKRKKALLVDDIPDSAAIEASLALPVCNLEEKDLFSIKFHTNRAPLVLAFAVTLLKYTMPHQPLSSRLSLAQAVVSVNSRSKAVSLGIEKGSSAEDEGWGQGQPKVRIMGRDIRVMKRWGYDPSEAKAEQTAVKTEDDNNSQTTVIGDNVDKTNSNSEEPALWGLDLEALRAGNSSLFRKSDAKTTLPIYAPESARAYLLKSFASTPAAEPSNISTPKKRPSGAVIAAEKEQNLAQLLKSIDLLYASWAHYLSIEELDRLAWSWYVAVRPEVQDGVAGWGGKGDVKLEKILQLRRKG